MTIFLRLLILICLLVGKISVSWAQNEKSYWQQRVDYDISVQLDDVNKKLNGIETFQYYNNSPDTLHFIWIHLWPNAYSNDTTAFSKQKLRLRDVDFYFSDENERGNIIVSDISVNGENVHLKSDSNHVDVAKLVLNQPLLPHRSIEVKMNFAEKLPFNFSRGGYSGDTYQITQWYPKPAVYDSKGWHPMPYLEQGEFYSEFGKFNVSITTPPRYKVAASGRLLSQHENTAIYHLDNAHDFAWFASKDYKTIKDTIQLPGKIIQAEVHYDPELSDAWRSAMRYLKNGVHYYSKRIGNYPYDVVKIVSGPISHSNGGMEYPTIAVIPSNVKDESLETSIVHEVGHNWFYGALANNERDHAWMDEGMNTYYQQAYNGDREEGFYMRLPQFIKNKVPNNEYLFLWRILHARKQDQPIELTSDQFQMYNYGLSEYYKMARWMDLLEKKLGTSLFDHSMKSYYGQWQFKHPYPNDFKNSIERASDRKIDHLYSKLLTNAALDSNPNAKKLKLTFLFNLKQTGKYNYISLLPAVGFNDYDKMMVGGMVHNYQLPTNKFNFLLSPLYATGSKKWNGIGRLEWNEWQPNGRWQVSVSGITYTANALMGFNNKDWYMRMSRITPALSYTYRGNDLRVTKSWDFLLRSFFITEQNLQIFSIPNSSPTSPEQYNIVEKNTHRNLTQLQVNVHDSRVLYPYSANLTVDAGKNFVRAGLTGKYFFNYSGAKNKGVNVRFFAGKFFTIGTPENALVLQPYYLTLSAPHGNSDYTYSDYFLGRNRYDGWTSQQVMERDGYMKVYTPYSSTNIGMSDDWIAALNFTADIPKIPFKLFFDLGTYSDVWKDVPPTGRFLYDAGVEFCPTPLLRIYVPLLYSKVYRDAYKLPGGGYFWKTISFDINLNYLQKKTKSFLW